MEMIKANGFDELTFGEMTTLDGGIVIAGVVVSGAMLLKAGITFGVAGFTVGTTVGLNRKNRK